MVSSADELRVPAREPSMAPVHTNQLQKDLSSDAYLAIKNLLTPEQIGFLGNRYRE